MFFKPKLNFLVISDIHHPLKRLPTKEELKKIDVCLILGDVPKDIILQFQNILSCEIYGVLGNHDTYDTFKETKVIDLNGKTVNIKGLKIGGIEGSCKYKANSPYVMHTHTESVNISKELDKDINILISHESPYCKYTYAANKCGLLGVSSVILKNKPFMALHGHHHVNDQYQIDKTECFCLYRVNIVNTKGCVKHLDV